MTSTIDNIIITAKALVDAVTFDDSGSIIGGQFMGGHGGLLSRETIKMADALRLALDAHRQGANAQSALAGSAKFADPPANSEVVD